MNHRKRNFRPSSSACQPDPVAASYSPRISRRQCNKFGRNCVQIFNQIFTLSLLEQA